MAPTRHEISGRNGVERVREELLTALHFGKLMPGDRVPSVRRLADRTGMNRKTVHRAYTRLAHEGLLDLRPGSGTFIAEERAGTQQNVNDLIVAANRCRAVSEGLGLSPRVFSLFLDILMRDGLARVPLAVAECNMEQLGLIADELRDQLGVAVRPILLSALEQNPAAAVRGTLGIITTDCHHAEVASLVDPLGLPAYRLALDPLFPQRLVEHLRRAPVVMVVRDRKFAPVFRHLLQQLMVGADTTDRLQIVEPTEARSLLWRVPPETALHVSPQVERQANGYPTHLRRLRLRWRVEPASLERLKVGLALDLASKGAPGNSPTGQEPAR